MKAKVVITSKKPKESNGNGKWLELIKKMDKSNKYLILSTNSERISCCHAARQLGIAYVTWKTDDNKICFERI
jgi:hypothetical protein